MSFLYPEFIYLMMPILLVLFGLLLTKSDVQELLFSPETLAKLRVDTDQISAKIRNFFYFLMFLFIILALSAPVIEKGSAKVKVKDAPIFIALDISDSMLCQDVYPNRLELGKKKIVELLQEVKRNSVGLIAFSNSSYLVSPLTKDYRMLSFFLTSMKRSYSDEHGTNILNLLKAANRELAKFEEKKLFIVSDGGDKREFSQEIAYAKDKDIKVYFLAIGTEKGGAIELEGSPLYYQGKVVISRVNSAIETLALESGGAIVDVRDFSPFIASLKRRSLREDEKPIYFHLFIVPIALAMLMLLIATSSFHRGEKYYLPSLAVLILITLYPASGRATFFDFQRLERANTAYTQEEYGLSANSYRSYALKHKSVEAAYNAANAYYKMGRYKMAVELYESIYFAQDEKNYQLYHNLGNALAMLGRHQDLKKAISAYEKALKLKDERETRENLDAVIKALQKGEERAKKKYLKQILLEDLKVKKTVAKGKNTLQNSDKLQYHRVGMSEREAEKWLKLVQKQQHVQGYKIEVLKPDEGVSGENPW